MKNNQLVLLLTVVVVLLTSIVLVYLKVNHLALANRELRDEIELLRAEREEAKGANEQLRRSASRAETDLQELVRLRNDVSRLRRDVALVTNRLNKTVAPAQPAPATNLLQTPLTPFTGTARVSLQPGQALIMGGWPTQPGKRTLALFTPEVTSNGNQTFVLIRAVYVQVPETLLVSPGWEQFQNVTEDTPQTGVLSPEHATQFLEIVQEIEGVDVLSKPQVLTLSGREANISIGESPDSGLSLSLVPTVAVDQQTIDLVLTNRLALK